MIEIWKDILNYEGLYQVSNLGRVRSLDRVRTRLGIEHPSSTIKGRILKLRVKDNLYLYVGLCVEGVSKNNYIHRLVAQAFIENPNDLPVVNHLDSNRQNNSASNLQWCTTAENVHHCINSGRKTDFGIRSPNTTITLEEISTIKKLREEGLTYLKISEVTGWSKSCVGQICRGTRHARQLY